MDIYEEAVLEYLTHDQKTFAIPQFTIGTEGEWSCPDFVTISPASRECYVVEVSTAWNVERLIQKVRDKENQWLNLLKDQLEDLKITNKRWTYGVKIFVRKDRLDHFKKAVDGINGVRVFELEQVLPRWNYSD